MANLDAAREIVEALFIEQADNYCNKDLEATLAHYTEKNLLFWNAEGDVITDHEHLCRWYDELFSQFDIKSVRYEIEYLSARDDIIVCASLWVVDTVRKQGSKILPEEQPLRATHILRREGNFWVIQHLHTSSSRHIPE